MKCNRNCNPSHCQFNRNRRLSSRSNLEIFTLHHCALNRVCGGWVSSYIIVCYMFQRRPLDRLCALNPDSPAASTAFVANSRFVQLPFLLAARSNVASLARRSNKKKSFTWNGLTLRQQNKGTLRGDVLVLFMYIHSELNASAGVGYVCNYRSFVLGRSAA